MEGKTRRAHLFEEEEGELHEFIELENDCVEVSDLLYQHQNVHWLSLTWCLSPRTSERESSLFNLRPSA